MKLFGSESAGGPEKPPKQKKPKRALTRKQIVKRIIISVAIVLALCAAGAAFWVTTVRAPDPSKQANNHTIEDAENGDAPDLDMGDRIADYFTFVVGAVDEDQTRTDALMVCGFDTKSKEINILNIPRDTMSDVSRKGAAKKINAAYGTNRGIDQTKAEIKKLLGFTPDYHIIVNFQGIADIVDAIGGVDYEIPFRMYYKDPSQNLNIDFKPGMRHMNGKEVVEFLRWRKNNGGVKTGDANYTGGDEERIDKQQEFLQHLAAQVLKPANIKNVGKISDVVFKNVKTDLTAGEILWMGMQAVGTSDENIKMHKLPGYETYSYAGTSWYGSFFFPSEQKTLALINEYFNPYVDQLTDLDIVSGPDKRTEKSTSQKSTKTTKTTKTTKKNTSKTTDRDEDKNTQEKDPESTESGESTGGSKKPSGDTSGGTSSGDKSEGSSGEDTTVTPPKDKPTTPPAGDGSSTTEKDTSSDNTSAVTPPSQSKDVDPEA